MRSFRRLYCGTAALQAALLPVLAASVSSHHHEDPHRSLDGVAIDHDHSDHAHGTVLVDQDDDDRNAADGPGIPRSHGSPHRSGGASPAPGHGPPVDHDPAAGARTSSLPVAQTPSHPLLTADPARTPGRQVSVRPEAPRPLRRVGAEARGEGS